MPELPPFDKLWNYSDPAGTELKFREILDTEDTRSDLAYHLQLLTQIARTYGLRHMFSEAHALLDEVKTALPDQPELTHVRYHLERGRTYNSQREKENARAEFDAALAVPEEVCNDFHTVDTMHMLAIVSQPIPDEAIQWNMRAMQKAESSPNERAKGWLGSLYNNLGWDYFNKGDYDTALEIFTKGLSWQQERNREKAIVIAKWTIARTYRALGRVQEALELQLQLEKESKEQDGYIFEEIGECLLVLERKEESKPHFAKAYALLNEDKYLQRFEADRLKRILELSA